MSEINQILGENIFDFGTTDKILRLLTEIIWSVLYTKFERKGFSQKTIEQKFSVIGTGSWTLNTCISSSDVDTLCILTKDISEEEIVSENKRKKCVP